jgi:acetylornithine deacetylase
MPNQELTDLLTTLVSIDSVNPDLVPGGAGEQDIASFIASWAQAARSGR